MSLYEYGRDGYQLLTAARYCSLKHEEQSGTALRWEINATNYLNLFRTAVSFWGQATYNLSVFSPKTGLQYALRGLITPVPTWRE